jgi:hypothetical protein
LINLIRWDADLSFAGARACYASFFCTTMRTVTLSSLPLCFSMLAVTVITQPSPPAQGVQLSNEFDTIFPLTVSQCAPVFIYYNTTPIYGYRTFLTIYTLVYDEYLLRFELPLGVGYLEWICNIPAGYGFIAGAGHYFVVQSGTSSSCLRNVTASYPFVSYNTTAFLPFTQSPPNTTLPNLVDPAPYVNFLMIQLFRSPSHHLPRTVPLVIGSFATVIAKSAAFSLSSFKFLISVKVQTCLSPLQRPCLHPPAHQRLSCPHHQHHRHDPNQMERPSRVVS